ncbi:reductase [Perkinsela sp. CCAP 1560/4]|nr:reductase [Perkinsela sp. CCAP 1560/4]|eukprot:KNH07494.1 reductase [Perkinsela sp. CCAP 1560/4]
MRARNWIARDGSLWSSSPQSYLFRQFPRVNLRNDATVQSVEWPSKLWTSRVGRGVAVAGGILAFSMMTSLPSFECWDFGSLIDTAHADEITPRNATVITFSDTPSTKASKKHLAKAMNYQFAMYTLGEVIPLTRDVALFRFLLPETDSSVDLHPCINIEARFYSRGKFREAVTRHYTPVTTKNAKGHFDILVRKRSKGMMTEHLFGLLPGDEVEFRLAPSKLKYRPNKWKEVGMVCGGTGITPMLQILRYALDSENGDDTRFSMIYSNRSEEHIPFKSYLDDLAVRFPKRFQVKYGVDVANDVDNWDGFVGFTSHKNLNDFIPPPSKQNLVLVCGPDEFVGHLTGASKPLLTLPSSGKYIQHLNHGQHRMGELSGELRKLGYRADDVYVF